MSLLVCSLAAQRYRAACVQPCGAHSAQLRAYFAGSTSRIDRSRLRVGAELAERVLTEPGRGVRAVVDASLRAARLHRGTP